jgi:hypothetical protein
MKHFYKKRIFFFFSCQLIIVKKYIYIKPNLISFEKNTFLCKKKKEEKSTKV